MNIYIANIPFKANENDVRELFARYGQVASVRIVLDKETQKSRGFGFVMMNNDLEASQAIQGLNGFNYQGKALAVSEAKPKEGGDRPINGPRRNFSNERTPGDRPSRPFTPRNISDRPDNNRPYTPRNTSDRPDSNRPYTPRTNNSDYVAAPPVFFNDPPKPKREKEFKKDKPDKAVESLKSSKKDNKVKKYNRFDDDGDDFDYKIGKY